MTMSTRSSSRRNCLVESWSNSPAPRSPAGDARRRARRTGQIRKKLEQVLQFIAVHVANELRFPRVRRRANAALFRGVRRLRRAGLRHRLPPGRARDWTGAGHRSRTMLWRRLPSRGTRVFFRHMTPRNRVYTRLDTARGCARLAFASTLFIRNQPTTTRNATRL